MDRKRLAPNQVWSYFRAEGSGSQYQNTAIAPYVIIRQIDVVDGREARVHLSAHVPDQMSLHHMCFTQEAVEQSLDELLLELNEEEAGQEWREGAELFRQADAPAWTLPVCDVIEVILSQSQGLQPPESA